MRLIQMNKKPLKIGFIDFAGRDFFIQILSARFDLTIDDANPDFLFFGDENFGTSNISIPKSKCIKIFFTGENRRPENYDCHYAITFDYNHSPWHHRLSGWAMVPFWYNKFPMEHMFGTHLNIMNKSKFAVFMHRNPYNQIRNTFFHELSKYKKVDSAGPVFNNIGYVLGKDYDTKLEFIKDYKFVFAFENSSYPGYITEKIMDGFYVNSIPIYWGSDTVDMHFNTKSFINCHDYNSFEEVIQKIIEVDNNDDLYHSYVSQPKFRHNIVPDELIYNNFLNWFESIVYEKKFAR